MTRPTFPYIRNACVAFGAGHGGALTTAFTVPEQMVLLIKHVSILYFGPAAATIPIYLVPHTTGGSVVLDEHAFTAAGFWTWQGWAAVNALDFISIGSDGGDYRYWLSGALLPFNPQFSPEGS